MEDQSNFNPDDLDEIYDEHTVDIVEDPIGALRAACLGIVLPFVTLALVGVLLRVLGVL